MRVALFGGSFDPPHLCHVLNVALALSTGELDRVLVVPCFKHPFDKQMTPYGHRMEMARLAFAVFKELVEVSSVEEELGGVSRTLDTLLRLAEDHPEWRLRLLIGSDIPEERENWHRFDEVERLAPPLVVGRSGHPIQGDGRICLPGVSSTEIRDMLASGRDVEHLVPQPVLQYIVKHGLYSGEK